MKGIKIIFAVMGIHVAICAILSVIFIALDIFMEMLKFFEFYIYFGWLPVALVFCLFFLKRFS
jgi:hypothetical protein